VLYGQLGLPARVAYAIRHETDILRETCKVVEAESLYLEAEEIYRQLGEKATLDLANTIRGLALVNESAAKMDASKALWQELVSCMRNATWRLALRSATRNFLDNVAPLCLHQ
jgi:hypothetical protein